MKQEEINIKYSLSRRGGVAHLTHTNGKHLGNIYFDELSGADETYARTLPNTQMTFNHKRLSE